VAGGLLILVGVASVQIGQQIRQDNLDHALILAVKKLDAPAINRLLDEGASADPRDSGEPPPTLPNVYRWIGSNMEGWLCPALFKYFTEAPRLASKAPLRSVRRCSPQQANCRIQVLSM
jgi:hypothetical protein